MNERERIEEALRESEERYRALMEQSVEAIYLYDTGTKRVLESNAAFRELVGYSEEELLGMRIYDFIDHDREDIDANIRRSLEEKRRHIGERRYRCKDGSVIIVDTSASVISYDGKMALCAVSRDVTERKQAEKERARRTRQIALRAEVSAALAEGGSLRNILQWCTETMVRHLDVAFARIWTLNEEEDVLELQASAGMYTHLDGAHSRVPVGRFKIGLIAEELEPHLTNDVAGDPRISDKEWAKRERMVAFAGYPLVVEDRLVGIMAMFARQPLAEDTIESLSFVADMIAQGIERKRAEEALRKSEERFRSLTQNASDIITILEADGTIRYDSPAVERVLGYSPRERVGASAFDYIHPEDVERVRRSLAEALDAPSAVRPPLEFRVRHRDGSWRCLEVTRSNLLDDPAVRGVVANSRDVTERKEAEESLAEERNLLRTLIDNMPDFIFVKDVESRFIINSAEHARALGAPEEELLGKTDFDVFPRELAERYYADEQEVVKSGRPLIDREEPVTDSDGNERWLSTTKVPLRNGTGRISGLVGISRDITERKALEDQLRHQAFYDPLTKLPNRALFLDRLEHSLERSRRLGKSIAVLFADLDDFKLVNDALGHEKGDRLLVKVAERLTSCVRPGDTVARIFGDEFGVLLEPPTDVDDARRITGRMQERLQKPFGLDGREVFVNSSVGIAMGEPDRAPDRCRAKDILRRADLAMYVAKRRGKNRCEVFSPSMDMRASERMELENDLRGGIERNEFEVHYQPIIALETGRIRGLEALARWEHPERGLLAAREFAQLAEETGLIRTIGRWVFEEACRQARRWNELHPLMMSVNFSVNQFAHQADLIPRVLSETELDPRILAVEITERAVMDDAEFALGKLRRLKDLGMSFGIDDYGTGYSCLRYLKLMPVDFLKIDQSFVAGLGEDRGDEAIVSGTIDLAHALGLKVIAEGVETAGQLERLKQLNCDLAQGFYLSEPLPGEEVSALLTRRR